MPEEQPPDQPISHMMARLEVYPATLPVRWWYLADDGKVLLQVQHDRFAQNWRRTSEGEQYPRYERLLPSFQEDFQEFQRFLNDEGLARPVPTQCEVNYINPLQRGRGWDSFMDVDRVVTSWRPKYADHFLKRPEQVRFEERHLIEEDGLFRGRLYVGLEPVLRLPDLQPLMVLNLTARGAPIGTHEDGITKFFDLAHEWIVRAFASITTTQMHRLWEREDGIS